jgi:hypothetical protein
MHQAGGAVSWSARFICADIQCSEIARAAEAHTLPCAFPLRRTARPCHVCPSPACNTIPMAELLYACLVLRSPENEQFIHPVACRLRVGRRFKKVAAVLDLLCWDRAAVRGEVATPWHLAPEQMGTRPGGPPQQFLDPGAVITMPLQAHHATDSLLCAPMAIVAPHDHDLLETVPLAVPLAYEEAGYRALPHWGLLDYIPPFTNLPLETGALDEVPARAPRALLISSPVQFPETLPPTILQIPRERVPISGKWASTVDAVGAPRLRAWGFDSEHRIQPKYIGFHSSCQHEHGASNSVRALHGQPVLAGVWQRQRRDWMPALALARADVPVQGTEESFPLGWVRSTWFSRCKVSSQVLLGTSRVFSRSSMQ